MPSLTDSVSVLDHVGAKRLEGLHSLGIKTIGDLLSYFPFRYIDYHVSKFSDAQDGDKITLEGVIANNPSISTFGYHRSRLIFKLQTKQDPKPVNITLFNQPWVKKRIKRSETVAVFGKVNTKYHNLVVSRIISGDRLKRLGGMGAVYPSNRRTSQNTIRKLIIQAYRKYHQYLIDFVPEWIQRQYRLEPSPVAIHDLHFPANGRAEQLARRTAKFDCFFAYELRLQVLKQSHHKLAGLVINYNQNKVRQFINSLPYQLTSAQQKVIQQIDTNLAQPSKMNRLLQGDVGSGKTVVAAAAIYATVTAGYQTALMAPTEILAEQHANNLAKTFRGFHINIGLLTGNTRPKQKTMLLDHLRNGDIDLLIGTDALIQPDVSFKNLGFAVIDEQHRFGVKQRQALDAKGMNRTNMLAMSATPIPRTLALTAYGQMDVSIIDQLPKGRKPVKTAWIRNRDIQRVMWFFAQLLQKGQQMYVVAPLIEGSKGTQRSQLADVKSLYAYFKRAFGRHYRVGILYGSMPNDQKNRIMDAFKHNRIQVLVSTTVIEVGVDAQNATVMMIYNADHFGLAQLHQLRGRVGRGSEQAYCLLVANPKTKSGVARMNIMTKTDNGFIISQKDLELRGSGNVFGQSQSGIPKFKVGDPIDDRIILSCAQADAERVVSEPHWQKLPKNQNLIKKFRIGHSPLLNASIV